MFGITGLFPLYVQLPTILILSVSSKLAVPVKLIVIAGNFPHVKFSVFPVIFTTPLDALKFKVDV